MLSIASPLAGQRFVLTTFWSSGASSTSANRVAEGRRVCKGNSAAYDRRIMPQGKRPSVASLEQVASNNGWQTILALFWLAVFA